MKKSYIYSFLIFCGLTQITLASDLPKLQMTPTPKVKESNSTTVPLINQYNNGYNCGLGYCYNHLIYYTMLTSSEIRAKGDTIRRARLEEKCKKNKAKKSKCKELMED